MPHEPQCGPQQDTSIWPLGKPSNLPNLSLNHSCVNLFKFILIKSFLGTLTLALLPKSLDTPEIVYTELDELRAWFSIRQFVKNIAIFCVLRPIAAN